MLLAHVATIAGRLSAVTGLCLVLSGCGGEVPRSCAAGDCGDFAPIVSQPAPACFAGMQCNGYTLLAHGLGATLGATLIDMAGNVVHRWPIGGFPPVMRAGGSLAGCAAMWPGAAECVHVQEVSWTGEALWSFADWTGAGLDSATARQHHDLQQQGDPVGYYSPGQTAVDRGRTLMLAYARRSVPQIRDAAIDDDVIYELDGFGNLTRVVWYGADHFEEFGFDELARAHLRNAAPGAIFDWLHGNAISVLGPNRWFDEGHAAFHPDNIMYSSRAANFIAILSRETGAVVWRVGPDFAGRPEEHLGQFSGQHNPHLVPAGLPGAGNVLVFDNGGPSGYGGAAETGYPYRYARDYSRVLEFNPVTLELVWEYGSASGPERFFSYLVGGAQRLPNGNTLITIGLDGRVLEVTPEKQVVWQYVHEPLATDPSVRWLYRSSRVPPEWLPPGENGAHGNYRTWASLFEAR